MLEVFGPVPSMVFLSLADRGSDRGNGVHDDDRGRAGALSVRREVRSSEVALRSSPVHDHRDSP